jgi:NAD(P)-dependent dehydrogenase (short-subunit alcohol dehydrogenase family)
MARSLKNVRVWITGASSGIGRAVAIELARRGCRIALSARSREPLDRLAHEIGNGAISIPIDVTGREANLRAAAEIESRFGGLDIAFFNAGSCEYVETAKFDSAVFERMMRLNFLSMVYGIEAALPLLRRSPRPQIVGMSSAAAYRGLPRAEAYGASKAAARHMLQSLRLDLAPAKIRVTIVCPGFVRTPLTDKNDFSMPMLVEPVSAARRIADGIERLQHEIHFPKLFTGALKILSLMPSPLYARLAQRIVRSS